jgi:hypothetical protein
MSNVTSMDDHRPHMTMRTQRDRVHVIPASVFVGIAKGDLTVDCLDDRDELMSLIVAEWLDFHGLEGAEYLRVIEGAS